MPAPEAGPVVRAGRADSRRRAGRSVTAGRWSSPSRRGKPISATTPPKMLQHHRIAAVAHGFRSSFRDWAAEETDHPREVIEAALAHVVQNKVQAAYARSDLFERRRRLMDDWAAYIGGERGAGRPASPVTPRRSSRCAGEQCGSPVQLCSRLSVCDRHIHNNILTSPSVYDFIGSPSPCNERRPW